MGLDFDDELLCLASLAQDVGLLDSPCPAAQPIHCFSIRSADWAINIARDAGWNAARQELLREAITLDLNSAVPRRHGVTTQVMMLGVLADVTGIYRWRVDPVKLRALYRGLPVCDKQLQLVNLFVAEADRHLRCRGHFAVHRLGFGYLMRHAPQVAP